MQPSSVVHLWNDIMAKRKKIQDYDWRYSLLKRYVDSVFKLSYRPIKYIGKENIPTDGAVIFAPNHTGTLMDALVILAMDSKPKAFVARADIFKNPKLAKLFRFFKMMPIMRMRDGFDEVKKNNKIIEQATDVLKDKVPFCIFPEGTHQTKYSLQPLSKGIFRIALQAKEFMPDTPLYIVPVGIIYGSFWRFRASARVYFGNPINVGEIIAQNEDKTPQELMVVMRAALTERMKDALLYIPNDENYDATYEICAAVSSGKCKERLAEDKNTAKRVLEMKENAPEQAVKLFALANEASKMRKKRGISLKSVAVKHSFVSQLFRALLLLVTLPYTLAASLLVSPMLLLCNTIFKKFKDQAFRNSVRMVMNLVLWPLLMIIYAIVAYICLPWQWALPLTLVMLPAPYLVHDAYKVMRILVSDSRLCRYKELRAKYQEIRAMLFN